MIIMDRRRKQIVKQVYKYRPTINTINGFSIRIYRFDKTFELTVKIYNKPIVSNVDIESEDYLLTTIKLSYSRRRLTLTYDEYTDGKNNEKNVSTKLSINSTELLPLDVYFKLDHLTGKITHECTSVPKRNKHVFEVTYDANIPPTSTFNHMTFEASKSMWVSPMHIDYVGRR